MPKKTKKVTRKVTKKNSTPSTKGKAPEAGDLDGIRGNPRLPQDEALIEAHESVRALLGMGTNVTLIRDVIMAGELAQAIEDDGLIGNLVTRAETLLAGCQNAWASSADPGSPDMRKIHIEAKAAQMIVAWVEEIFNAGRLAEQQIENGENEHD